jgi:hypothetical protein
MKWGWVAAVLALLTGLAGRAGAQEILFVDPTVPGARAAGGQFLLSTADMPVEAGGQFFQDQTGRTVRPPGAPLAGTVSQLGLAQPGPVVSNIQNVSIGFDYLRPLWTFNEFTLVVPTANARNFPLLADTGHADDHFAFAPIVKYNYQVNDTGLGVGISGKFLNLSGHLERGLSLPPVGLAELRSSGNLTLVVANLPEITQRIYLEDVIDIDKDKPCLRQLVLDLSLGTRFASLTQNYDSSLITSNGSNASTRHAEQSFKGFGLTGAVDCLLPVKHDLILFLNTRCSILVGDNIKRSTTALTIQGDPAASQTYAIDQDSTVFLPVVEWEVGAEWGRQLADALRANEPGPRFTLRTSFVSQFWGDVGPFSAGISTQGFRASDLFLIGVNVTAGLYF